jgi:hypothetical protein
MNVQIHSGARPSKLTNQSAAGPDGGTVTVRDTSGANATRKTPVKDFRNNFSMVQGNADNTKSINFNHGNSICILYLLVIRS